MLVRSKWLNLVVAALVGVAVIVGHGLLWLVCFALGLVLLGFGLTYAVSGARSRRIAKSAAWLTLSGVPTAAALGVVAGRRVDPSDAWLAGLIAFVGGLIVLIAIWVVLVIIGLIVRRHVDPMTIERRRSSPAEVAKCVGAALAVVAASFGADAVAEARMSERVSNCALGDALPHTRSRSDLEEIAAACDKAGGVAEAHATAAGVSVSVMSGPRSPKTVADVTASALSRFTELLGPPTPRRLLVVPVGLHDRVRGQAGPGYILINAYEVAGSESCDRFLGSAGVFGVCPDWVLAHEVAHQWFRWTSFTKVPSFWPVVIEGTADYLAFDWWRSTKGAADADALASKLFDGRLSLARSFATTHVPAHPPRGMTDAEQRSLVYGRASAAWIAAERATNAETTREVLRAVFEAGRAARHPSLEQLIAAAASVDKQAAAILRTWWTDNEFEPRL